MLIVGQYWLYCIGVVIYNLFFHRLRHFPGPWTRTGALFFTHVSVYKGDSVADLKRLHDEYGDVVRVTPEAVSFRTSQAVKGQRCNPNLNLNPTGSLVVVLDTDGPSRYIRTQARSRETLEGSQVLPVQLVEGHYLCVPEPRPHSLAAPGFDSRFLNQVPTTPTTRACAAACRTPSPTRRSRSRSPS